MQSHTKQLLKKVADLNAGSGLSQKIYILEECSEVIKEITKSMRGKNNDAELIEEICDVITASSVFLCQQGISDEMVEQHIRKKCQRALDRGTK